MTSGTACQHFSRISPIAFIPGDTIELKAGDTFTGETFTPLAVGGIYDGSLFDSTYTSTLASQQTACNASGTFTNFQTKLTADGAGDATALATEYCRRLSWEAAEIAARDAAEAASTWITITKYGAGANPIIAPGGSINYAIDLSGTDFHYKGGWKIDHVDLRDAQLAGIHAENPVPTGTRRGLWITGSTIQNITGVAFTGSPSFSLNTPVAGYTNFMASGIDTAGTQDVFADNMAVNTSDQPYWMVYANNVVLDASTSDDSLWLNPYLGGFGKVRSLIRGCHFSRQGRSTLSTGRSGATIGGATEFIIDNTEIDTTPGATDSVAFDSEGSDINLLVNHCNFHDNGGAAFLFDFDTNTGTMIVGNTFTNNGIGFPANTEVNIARACGACGVDGTKIVNDRQIYVDNVVTRATSPAQSFDFANQHNINPTIVCSGAITQCIFGADNTVN